MSRTTDLGFYKCAKADSDNARESMDCAVMAVSMATGTSYPETLAAFTAAGRKPKHRTPMVITDNVIAQLGYSLETIPREIWRNGPGAAKTVITAARRFDSGTYLLRSRGHILCLKDGQALDWAADRRLRMEMIYCVKRLAAEPTTHITEQIALF